MTDNEFAAKIRSLGFLKGGRTKPRVREGKQHWDSGAPYKATTDEAGNTVTEHNNKEDRQDVHIQAKPIIWPVQKEH